MEHSRKTFSSSECAEHSLEQRFITFHNLRPTQSTTKGLATHDSSEMACPFKIHLL